MVTSQQQAARQRDKFVPLPEDEEECEEDALAAGANAPGAAAAASAAAGMAPAGAAASLESMEGGLAAALQLSDAVALGEDMLQVWGGHRIVGIADSGVDAAVVAACRAGHSNALVAPGCPRLPGGRARWHIHPPMPACHPLFSPKVACSWPGHL